jgi:type VI secretion system secreted protein Hcp
MDLVLLKPGNTSLWSEDGLPASQIEGDLYLGESDGSDSDLTGCIELVSLSYGMAQQMTTDVSNSARTSGRPTLSDVTCVKYLDRSSPNLYKHCLSGAPIDDGEEPTKIYLCRNANFDEDSNNIIAPIMVLTLYNCMISSIQSQSHSNDMATEQLMLNFTDIEWTATHQTPDAKATGNVAFAWSVARNRNYTSGAYQALRP